MPYVIIFAVSAPVEVIEHVQETGSTILKSSYISMSMVTSWEEALPTALKLVRDRFEGQATIRENMDGEALASLYIGSTAYAPLGVTEVPLIIVQSADFDASIDTMDKFFSVPTASLSVPEVQ